MGSPRSIVTCCPTESLISAVAIFLVIYIWRRNWEWRKLYQLPPGPRGLPILGIFHKIYDYPAHLLYTAYKSEYGAIFTANVMGEKTVILNDIDTVREAMLKRSPAVDDRPSWRYCFIKLLKGLSVLPYSQQWYNTRRRTLMILRDYGMGRSFLEPQICQEAHALIANIMRDCDDGRANITMKDRTRRAPINIICKILFNKRYDYDDKNLLFILDTMEFLLTFLRTACTHDSLPTFLRPIMKRSLRDFHGNIEILHQFLGDEVKHHVKTYRDDETRDFIDAWIKCQKACRLKTLQQDDIANNNCAEKNLEQIPTSDAIASEGSGFSPLTDVLQDVLFAGAHSTGYALNWLIMLVTLRKDTQDKAYAEIMHAVGPSNHATMNDKPKLPIVEAIIHETLRISTLVPLVGHACTKDVTIHGYNLPKSTEVTYNNWSINHDEANFPDAYTFLPERWLKPDGTFNRTLTTKFFPFGIGKRACAGESLARTELFLFTTTLLQNLEFFMPDRTVGQEHQPEMKHIQSFVLEPKLYKIRVRRRRLHDL